MPELEAANRRRGCLPRVVGVIVLFVVLVLALAYCRAEAQDQDGDRNIPTTIQQGSNYESPSPSVSLPLSPSPSTSESEKLDIEGIQDQVSKYLANQFQMDLIDIKDDSSTYIFTVTVKGFSDREDQTDIPDNWEWFQRRLTTAQRLLAERHDISSDRTYLVLVDSEGEVMLSSLGGDIQENRYKTEKPPQTETPSVRPSSSSNEVIVWVSESGKRYHHDRDCSGMKSPRSISLSNAIAQGYSACSKCS